MLEDFVWSNRFERTGAPGRVLATILRYLYAVLRDFVSGQLTMRAMSLVYTTLLSIVPLLAFSFAILKGFGVFQQLEPFLYGLLEPLGAQGEDITRQILALVENVKGSVLGSVGLAVFLWTAISMVQKVEESFNYVWYVAKPRSFARRFSEYLIVLLVGPLVMVTAIGIITSIQTNTVVEYLLNNPSLGPIFVFAGKLVPYLLISGVFTFLYIFVPNTRVNWTSALFGGLAGGFIWVSMGAIFTNFILHATRTWAIYAGFAVAITTLIWLYLNWLILLIGAQLAFYHQRPAFLRIGRREPRLSNSMRERLALNIMLLVGQAFRVAGESVSMAQVSEQLGIPTLALAPLGNALEDAGLLISSEQEELLPGRDMSRIGLQEILAVVRERGDTGSFTSPRWTDKIAALGTRMDAAVAGVVGERSLADLLDEYAAESA
ncbi:MAG: YihY/virulence factor BrkB family protein [Gammaproteobacteria bacterium]|nr:MAG: YihY/virulence factor BrkB family protein [Gammaproteobacteria bacterium]